MYKNAHRVIKGLYRLLFIAGLIGQSAFYARPVSSTGLAVPPAQLADLSISKTDGQTSAVPDTAITYTIVVANAGPDRAKDAVVTDTFPATLRNVQWTCTASPGSQCGVSSGSGNINATVGLKPNGTATFVAIGIISSTATGLLVNTASVTPPAGVIDPAPGNNRATDVDALLAISLTAINSSPTVLGSATVFTATLTGASSLAYQWDFGDGGAAGGNPVIHTYSAAGWYTATVTAIGATSSLTATTPVTVTNLAPVANAGSDQSVLVGAGVVLDGSPSHDPDGHLPLAYRWQQTGGTAVVLNSNVVSQPTFTAPDTPAVLTFTLVVTDAYSLASTPDQVVATVGDRPIVGLAAINSSPVTLGSPTVFTATIAGGSNVTYQWAFGDRGTAIGNPVTHVYGVAGLYIALVTATNSAGSATATTDVVIIGLAPPLRLLYIPIVARDAVTRIAPVQIYLPLVARAVFVPATLELVRRFIP